MWLMRRSYGLMELSGVHKFARGRFAKPAHFTPQWLDVLTTYPGILIENAPITAQELINMVSIPQRMRKLQTKLLAIRLGSGALVLPKDVKRIHLRFAQRIDGGHAGPRYVLTLSSTQYVGC